MCSAFSYPAWNSAFLHRNVSVQIVTTLHVYCIARVLRHCTDAKVCLPAGDSDSVRGLPKRLLLQLMGELLLPGARA